LANNNVLLIACKTRRPQCFACAPCINSILANGDKVIGVQSCDGHHGNAMGAMLNSFDLWVKANLPAITTWVPYYGKCIVACGQCKPTMDNLINAVSVTTKQPNKVHEHQHPYGPTIFK
jgi:hypothetical protein